MGENITKKNEDEILQKIGRIEELVKSYLIHGGRASKLHNLISEISKKASNIEYLQEELRDKSREYNQVITLIHKLRIRARELQEEIKQLKFEIRNLKKIRELQEAQN